MNMADHALARRDGSRELVLNGVARLILRYRFVIGETEPVVAVGGVRSGVDRITIVRVNHVAGSAAGRTIIAGLIIRAKERQQRVDKASPLQSLEHGIGPRQRAKPPIAEPVLAALKNAQSVSGLRELVLRQRPDPRQDAFESSFFRRGSGTGEQFSRHALGIIRLS